MSSAIQDLINNAIGDGARSAKFEVQVVLPLSSLYPDDKAISVMAKTSSFPGKAHEMIPVKYKGRSIPTRGQVKYTQSWDCTFYLSEDHSLKLAFEQWIEAIDQKHNYDSPGTLGVSELQNFFSSSDTNYTMPIIISQLDYDMKEPTAVYTLMNCFPVQIGPLELSSESTGSIMEFTVTFALSHFIVNAEHRNSTQERWTEDLKSAAARAKSGTINRASNVTSQITGSSQFSLSNMAQSMISDLGGLF